MAEPVYPTLEAEPQGGVRPIGFEALGEPGEGQRSYAVQFTPSDSDAEKAGGGSEEIRLLERSSTPPSSKAEEKVCTVGLMLTCRRPSAVAPFRSVGLVNN